MRNQALESIGCDDSSQKKAKEKPNRAKTMSKKTDLALKEEEIAQRTAPPGEIVYQAIYDEGQHELNRTCFALGLSGLAAGLSMGASLMSEALLQSHLPNAPWTALVTKLGYSVGFLIVILGRQQLFTKNTLTVILPLLRKWELLGKVLRLWTVVLAANLLGAFLVAQMLAQTSLFDRDIHIAFSAIANLSIEPAFHTTLLRGIISGWLMALMVWLLPFAESARIWVIIILGYLIGLAGLPHIVAGSIESFYLVVTGEISWLQCFAGYLAPTLIGNVIGGVALVAAGAHAEFTVAKQ
jgi:formate/nitrite transporter FocA (FNT family)